MTSRNSVIATVVLIIIAAAFLGGCGKTTGKGNGIEAVSEKEKATETLNRYYASIDYSCKTSADCEIKNVANCCGQYPQCVNKNAKTDPELVRTLCEKEGAASICGFPSISSCECINSRCEGRP